jgi:hypothetical protein
MISIVCMCCHPFVRTNLTNNLMCFVRITYVKGTLLRDFRPSFFFHQTIPPGPLIYGLKPFRIWLRICRDNQYYSSFSGVIDTAETLDLILISVSAVSMTPLKPPWSWNLKYHRDFNHKFFVCGWNPAETVSAVSMTPPKSIWHHWNRKTTLRAPSFF